MTATHSVLAEEFLKASDDASGGNIDPEQVFHHLKETIHKACSLAESSSYWKAKEFSNAIQRRLYPEHSTLFVSDPPGGNNDRPLTMEASVQVICFSILNAIANFDRVESRKCGASELLKHCQSPFPKSPTPYADRKGLWDHTHTGPADS